MIGKIIAGSSFAGTVGYVMKEQSRVFDAEGVTPPDVRDMVQDFKDQTLLNPRIKNAVGHISLSFSPKDAPRMTDSLMLDIAKEYMQHMGITDTQYLLVRHLDQPHPHCHLVYNRVGNNGQSISDKNMKIRNAKVCRTLTEKYGLHLAPGKESVRRECLREPDRTKYAIYDTIKTVLPQSRSWEDMEKHLQEQCISMRYKYCGSTNRKQGVLFGKNGFEFSGSKIDRQFSYSKLNKHFTHTQQQTQYRTTLAKDFNTAIGNYRSVFTGIFGNMGGGGNKSQADAGSINFGGNIGTLSLPPNDSPVGLSAAQLQRKSGESPEEYIARITALLNTVAEAMAVAAMEQKRKLRDRKVNKTQNEAVNLNRQLVMKENSMMSYEMYEDFKETMVKTIKAELSTKHNQPTDNDLPQRLGQIVHAEQEQHGAIITQLAGRLESIELSSAKTQNSIDNLQASIDAIEIPAELPPRIIQHRVIFSSESPFVLSLVLFLFISCMILSSAIYFVTRPNYDRIDNDLKYRYIKMKGEATLERIAELEELFELHRDNDKIRRMKKDVEEYERTVKRKVQLEEQVRLKEREANRLNENASRLRDK